MSKLLEQFPGEWSDEPDELCFTDEATGLPIALRRNQLGAWCGYVGINSHHPWHGKDESEVVDAPQVLTQRRVSMDDVGVINLFCAGVDSDPAANRFRISLLVHCHGGLTYASEAHWENETRATWWFGFDCSHAGDLIPISRKRGFGDHGDVYRNLDYVKARAIQAAQDINAAAMAKAVTP